MPGPVVHTIIGEQLPGRFQKASGLNGDRISNVLEPHRRELVYGCQGPDPKFFNLNDYAEEGIASKLIKWWNHMGDIQYAFHKLKGPIIEIKRELNQLGNNVVLTAAKHSKLIRKIVDFVIKLRETSILASRIQRGFLKKAVLDNSDPFGLYISPMQTAGLRKVNKQWEMNHDEWSWFDILHSRRTGDFITELLDIATKEKEGFDGEKRVRPRLWSYAIGYLSHLAADVVGHAYVNSIVGGPYRLQQAQRHTVQEKIMDVWAYNYYYKNPKVTPDLKTLHDGSRNNQFGTKRYYMSDKLINSGMHKNFLFTGGRLKPRQWKRDPGKVFNKKPQKPITAALQLPDVIAHNFEEASGRAYGDPYGKISASAVGQSYRLWYMFFYGSTNTFSPTPPSKLPNKATIKQSLQKDWNDFKLKHVSNLLGQSYEAAEDLVGGGGGNRGSCLQQRQMVGGRPPKTFSQQLIDCIEDAAESVMNFFENTGQSIAKTSNQATKLAAAIEKAIKNKNIPMNAQLTNFSLQKLYEKLWQAYKRLLMLVTAIGFSYMYPEDLYRQQLRNLWDPTAKDGLKQNSPRDMIVKPGKAATGFPRRGMREAGKSTTDVLAGLRNESHLLVPTTDVEQPATIPGPDLYGTEKPHVFIDDPKGLNKTHLGGRSPPLTDWIPQPRPKTAPGSTATNITDPSSSGSIPSMKDFLAGKHNLRGQTNVRGRYAKPVLGNAVDLTVELYKQYDRHGTIPNLNMSGDRAIAFPNWASTSGTRQRRKKRKRWQSIHGKRVPWLKTPIDSPVFVPKVLPEDRQLTGPTNDSYY